MESSYTLSQSSHVSAMGYGWRLADSANWYVIGLVLVLQLPIENRPTDKTNTSFSIEGKCTVKIFKITFTQLSFFSFIFVQIESFKLFMIINMTLDPISIEKIHNTFSPFSPFLRCRLASMLNGWMPLTFACTFCSKEHKSKDLQTNLPAQELRWNLEKECQSWE